MKSVQKHSSIGFGFLAPKRAVAFWPGFGECGLAEIQGELFSLR